VKRKKQNRRYFIKSAIAMMVVGLAALLDKMVVNQKAINSKKPFPFHLIRMLKLVFWINILL